MCPKARLRVLLLSLLSAFILFPPVTLAAEDEYEDEYEETARVVRVSMTKGEVSLRRAGNIEWERAQLNVPLVEGDVLATGPNSVVEIQAEAKNFIRVGADSVVKVVTLRDEGVALSLSEGTASVRLARFDRDKEYFEIDAPGTTVSAEKTGLYRIDVATDGRVRVTVREDGRARVYSDTSGFVLRNNKTARFSRDAQGEGDWELADAAALDEWDFWNDERERHLAALWRFEERDRYYDNDVYGAEELDAYGDWTYSRDYGYLWRPHATVINNYYNWSPYRHGHWRWCPPYGWTWIPDEPWGWAPYHYGRWVYYNNNWCWAPRGYGYPYRRARWRPALVVFVNINIGRGHHIAWYPLRHGQRDPRGRHWGRDRDRDRDRGDRQPRPNPRGNTQTGPFSAAVLRSVSSVPAGEFGAVTRRSKAAPNEVAQRAVNGEPLRGSLPVTQPNLGSVLREGTVRAKSADAQPTGAGRRPALDIKRPTPEGPSRPVAERMTGAAARTPGVPLDAELRRTRVFGNREPRVAAPNTNPSTVDRGDENTGAVMRPAPGVRRKPIEGAGDAGNNGPLTRPNSDDADRTTQPRVRPTRPSDTTTNDQPTYEPVEPRTRRKPDADANPQPQPRRDDAPVYQPERNAPREERPAPPPTRTKERPDPPRYEPPPPPRQEQPRYEPPARRDPPPSPPPQRTEPPRQEQPRQSPPPRQEKQDRPAPSQPPMRRKEKNDDN